MFNGVRFEARRHSFVLGANICFPVTGLGGEGVEKLRRNYDRDECNYEQYEEIDT